MEPPHSLLQRLRSKPTIIVTLVVAGVILGVVLVYLTIFGLGWLQIPFITPIEGCDLHEPMIVTCFLAGIIPAILLAVPIVICSWILYHIVRCMSHYPCTLWSEVRQLYWESCSQRGEYTTLLEGDLQSPV